MVEIIINGVKLKVLKGTKILRAATMNCFNIPTLCNKPLSAIDEDTMSNRCGICVVEVTLNGKTALVPSCCTEVEDKMIINTLSKKVLDARKNRIQGLNSW